MTRRHLVWVTARMGLAALGAIAWPFGRAHAREDRPDEADARIRVQRARLERGLAPETLARCRRAAGRLAPHVDQVTRSPEWERELVSRIGAELEAEGLPVGKLPVLGEIVAAILAVIAAVLMLIGEILAAQKEDRAADQEGKDRGSDDKLRDLRWRVVERLEKTSDEDLFPQMKKP